jgi:hypothetical protein
MRRRLSNLATLISLALCLGVGVLWVVGRHTGCWVWWTRVGEIDWRQEALASGTNGFMLRHEWYQFEDAQDPRKHSIAFQPPGVMLFRVTSQGNPFSGSLWNRIGFGMERELRFTDAASGSRRLYYVCSRAEVPYWFVLAVLFMPCGLWLVHARASRTRARRARSNQCLQCGYDLRAHGEGERCPECGGAPGGEPAAAA